MNICKQVNTLALPAIATAALCTTAFVQTSAADTRQSAPIDSVKAPGAILGSGGIAGVSYQEDFESGYVLGPGCDQNGWTGYCGPEPDGFYIVNDSDPAFGNFSARHSMDGSTITGYEVVSPTFTLETGLIEADIRIADTTGLYQFITMNSSTNFFNTRINFESNGTITALQAADCVTGTFAATTGTWTPGVRTRIGVEVTPAGVLHIYQDGALIFTGHDISAHCSPGQPVGIGQVRIWADNASATNSLTLDNINVGGNECLLPLPFCPTDIAGDDGVTNVDDLLAVLASWGQNGNPEGPRPVGDVAPLPNGDCIVNVDDLLGVIAGWGACPEPLGACCLPNDTCQEMTASQCAAQSGTFLGAFTNCGTAVCPPENDNCEDALTAVDGMNQWNNAGATTDGPTATGCEQSLTRDVWFNYTASCDGAVIIDTIGSTEATDTLLAVYDGHGCVGALLACNDDIDLNNGILTSRVTVPVTAGQQLKIRVGTWVSGPTGAGLLNIACVDNDECVAAQPMSIGDCVTANLRDTTADQAETCNGVSTGQGRWYTVVGDGRTLTASTCGSPIEPWDLAISVYCGFSCNDLGCIVAANNDTCGAFAEEVSWCAAEGNTYYILVHSLSGNPDPGFGNYQLCITAGGSCNDALPCGNNAPNDLCQFAIDVTANIDGAPVDGDNTNATPEFGGGSDPDLPANSPSCNWTGNAANTHNTVWFKFTAPATSVTVETCSSLAPFNDSSLAIFSGSCGSLVEIGCGEDDCPTPGDPPYYSRAVADNLAVGQTYYVMVANPGGWAGSVPGPFKLTLYTGELEGACCVYGACIGVMSQSDCESQYGYWTQGETCATVTCDVDCSGADHSMLHQDPDSPAWAFNTTDIGAGTAGYTVSDVFPWDGGSISTIRVYGIGAVNPGSGFSPCSLPAGKTYLVEIRADNGGVPGAVEFTTTTTATVAATGEVYADAFPSSTLTFNVSTGNLSAGTKWLTIRGQSNPECWFLWLNAYGGPKMAIQVDESTSTVTQLGDSQTICINP